MVGSAVATIVWSSAASSMPSTIAKKMKLRRCGLIIVPAGAKPAAWVAGIADGVALVMPAFPQRSMLASAQG
jgi:hypothetical protein